MARPSKLTPGVQEKLVKAIEAGNYYDAACGFAGIHYSTFREWMIKGEKAKSGKFREFYEAIKKAEYDAEVRMVAQWQKQMPEDWKAIATFLERRHPEKWGRKRLDIDMKQEIQGQVEVKNDIAKQVINDPQASALAHKLLERIAENESSGDGVLCESEEMGTC